MIDGTMMNDDGLTDVILEVGIDAIKLDGTEDGTFVYATIANPDEMLWT